ncbi:hypothetical protein [Nocardia thailandica]|uniref:hypothetical protein n=1 Tax=Nocardia thailandica TaxID=257275 RepID=UPI0012FA2E75|nr:hypothetical protein [Nocardia thailandica]
MNKVQLEIRVNEIVNHVIAGGKVEDDTVEAKREWPKLDKAGQLAGMANAAGGQPILWIIGLCEGSHKIIPLDDTDPASWWQQMQGDFAYGVAPSMKTLRVVTDHGSVMALQFETDQAPYLVKLPKAPRDPNNPHSGYRWATAAIPWREGTTNRTATRAELLSALRYHASVPQLDVIRAECRLYAEMEATVPEPPSALDFNASLLIDTTPGTHTFFPAYRQRLTLTTSEGDELDISGTRFMTSSGFESSTQFNPYGATDRGIGLIVCAPDIVRVSCIFRVPANVHYAVAASRWIDLSVFLPISGSEQATTIRHRLSRVLNDQGEIITFPVVKRREGFWTSDGHADAKTRRRG